MPSTNTITNDDVNLASEYVGAVYKEAFFGRLAELGVVPDSEQEAHELAVLGEKVAQAAEDPRYASLFTKTASPSCGRFGRLNATLDRHVGVKQARAAGFDIDEASLAAAAELMNVPEVAAAAGILKYAQDAVINS